VSGLSADDIVERVLLGDEELYQGIASWEAPASSLTNSHFGDGSNWEYSEATAENYADINKSARAEANSGNTNSGNPNRGVDDSGKHSGPGSSVSSVSSAPKFDRESPDHFFSRNRFLEDDDMPSQYMDFPEFLVFLTFVIKNHGKGTSMR
jgi:hypothetical protein